MARVLRDAYGVPHVRAASVEDLARGQGRVTALDRSWQLELLRRRATGTSAALLGPTGLAWDVLARRARIADLARTAHAGLREDTRAFVDAYVVGVNEGLHGAGPELTALGSEPGPWESWTPLAVFSAQHLLFAGLAGKLWEHRARAALGEEARWLVREGEAASGSNAWAVGGRRTASGFPLVAGDPHRALESPGVYAQVRLCCEGDFDVVGLAFPGVPGVPHFGHAGEVAWAITNACGDYQDVYAERLRRTPTGVEALGPEGWEACRSRIEVVEVRDGDPVLVEVVTTARGDLVEGSVDAGGGLALRTASMVLGDLGFDALLPLLRARSVDDVDAALDAWVEPVNNVVAADRSGVVRYRVAGRVPVRAEANRHGVVDAADPGTAWTGWVDPLPRHDVDPAGQVVTANERRGPESSAIGTVFAPPYRARRIAALLEGRDGLGVADCAAVHDDAWLATAAPVQDLLRDAPAGAARDAILGWDGHMRAGSTGAGAFAAWRHAFVRRVVAEPVLDPLRDPVPHSPVLEPWLDLTGRVALALDTLVRAGTPFGLDLRALAVAALEDVGALEAWGATHVLAPVHALDGTPWQQPPGPRVELSGDTDCVRCTGSLPGVGDACARGSVARYAWDLADRAASGWVVPEGAQLELWAQARLAPVVTDWALLREE